MNFFIDLGILDGDVIGNGVLRCVQCSLVGHSGSRADIAKKPTSPNKSGKVFFQLTIAL